MRTIFCFCVLLWLITFSIGLFAVANAASLGAGTTTHHFKTNFDAWEQPNAFPQETALSAAWFPGHWFEGRVCVAVTTRWDECDETEIVTGMTVTVQATKLVGVLETSNWTQIDQWTAQEKHFVHQTTLKRWQHGDAAGTDGYFYSALSQPLQLDVDRPRVRLENFTISRGECQ